MTLNKENFGYHCWVVNKTNRKITIGDLRLTLKPYDTLDILDYRHSNLSIKQVQLSLESGSLCERKKQKKIFIREIKPEIFVGRTIELSKVSFPNKGKSSVKIEEKIFAEFEISDDDNKFAMENTENAIEEHAPQINFRKEENSYNNNQSFMNDDDEDDNRGSANKS